MNNVYILKGARFPIAKMNGAYRKLSAVDLGAELLEKLIAKAEISRGDVEGIYIGNVLSALLGQNPANQIKTRAGFWSRTQTAMFNKVCASSLLAVEYAYLKIATGSIDVAIAGGIESMSNAPLLLKRPLKLYDPFLFSYTLSQLQQKYPNQFDDPEFIDSLQSEGLCDGVNESHPVMGKIAEDVIRNYRIPQKWLDDYAYESYQKAYTARRQIAEQFVYVDKAPLEFDEGWREQDREKMRSMKAVFGEGGSLTIANSSQLSDGAGMLILASELKLQHYRRFEQQPLARIVACGSVERPSHEYILSPKDAIEDALQKTHLLRDEIDLFEINEAFPHVIYFPVRNLGIDPARINIWGGAISRGHPLGASGAIILMNLCYALKHTRGMYGIAVACNGGGGASWILVENSENEYK